MTGHSSILEHGEISAWKAGGLCRTRSHNSRRATKREGKSVFSRVALVCIGSQANGILPRWRAESERTYLSDSRRGKSDFPGATWAYICRYVKYKHILFFCRWRAFRMLRSVLPDGWKYMFLVVLGNVFFLLGWPVAWIVGIVENWVFWDREMTNSGSLLSDFDFVIFLSRKFEKLLEHSFEAVRINEIVEKMY